MGDFLNYKEEITKAMTLLGGDYRTIFLGQSVACAGNALTDTLDGVPMEKRWELPVAEDMQMGMSIGLSLAGYIPVSIYPRMDFLILALNQLVNHLDKMEEITRGQYKPKVIIRAAVGKTKPLFPGLQHMQDHTEGIKSMLTNVDVVKLLKAEDIVSSYQKALESDKSTMLVELCNLY